MNIQALKYNDIDLIKALQPEGWPDIFPSIEFYTRSAFCFPIKVIEEEKIIGIGTTIIHNEVAWLAHIIVHPGHRNKGIGKLITETLVGSTEIKSCGSIYLIATDLGVPVYEKTGFITETEYLFFKEIKTKESWRMHGNIVPYTEAFKTRIEKLDKRVSGEDRMFHIDQYLTGSYVYQNENIVEGFYLPAFGEGLIIAKTSLAGIELMKLRLTIKDHAVFPVDNLDAKSFMYNNGYKEMRIAKRMRLGKEKLATRKHLWKDWR